MSQSSNSLWLVSWTWQWVHFTQMASTVTRSQSNRVHLGCGGTGDSHHGCAADKSAATAWCYHVNMDQNLWGMFQHLVELELRQFWRQKGVQPGTSKVYLIKWPVSVYIQGLICAGTSQIRNLRNPILLTTFCWIPLLTRQWKTFVLTYSVHIRKILYNDHPCSTSIF